MAESGGNRSYDDKAHLAGVSECISDLHGVFSWGGDFGACLILDHVAILGQDDLNSFVCHNSYCVCKTTVVDVDCEINRLVNLKRNLAYVLCSVGYANNVVALVGNRCAGNVFSNFLTVLNKHSSCILFRDVNCYGIVYGKVCLVSLSRNCYWLSVDHKLVGDLCTVEVLEHDSVFTVCGNLIAGVVLDNLAILGYGYFCFIFPREGDFLIGVAVVDNALKVACGCGLSVGDLAGDCVHTGSELIGNNDLVHTGRSELVNKSSKLDCGTVVVGIENIPGLSAVSGLLDLKRLEVGYLICAAGYSDNELLCLLVCLEVNGRCIARDDDLELLGGAHVVYGLSGVNTGLGELANLICTKAADQIAVSVINVEHCHLIECISDGDRNLILEVVSSVKLCLHWAAFTDRIEDIRHSADNSEIVLTRVAVGIGYYKHVLAFDLIHAANECFAVNGYTDMLAKRNRLCKNGSACGVAIKVLIGACLCGFLFPVEVILDADLGILFNYLIESVERKVSNKLFGVAGLVVNVVGTVCCIGCINGVHRNTGIPSGVGPLSGLNLGVLTSLCKFKCALIGSESEDVFVDIVYLEVLLSEGIGKDVLLRGDKLSLPLVTCHINNLHKILTGVDGVNGCTVRNGLAVNSYGLNGSEGIRVAVRPSNLNVAIGLAGGYVGYSNLLDGTINDHRILTGRVTCGILSVKYVFTDLIKLGSGYVAYKGSSPGHLYVTGFVTLERNVLCVRISTVAYGISVCPKLSVGSLSVNGDRISRGLIACFIGCIEGISTFCGESSTGGVCRVTCCTGLLDINRAKTNRIGCCKLDRAGVGSASRCCHR